jgi:hypothetical protein
MNAQVLASIEHRLARLEATVNGRPFGNDEGNPRLSRTQTAQFLGVSPMTIIRRQAKDSDFPKPEVDHGRYFWRLSALRTYNENRLNV